MWWKKYEDFIFEYVQTNIIENMRKGNTIPSIKDIVFPDSKCQQSICIKLGNANEKALNFILKERNIFHQISKEEYKHIKAITKKRTQIDLSFCIKGKKYYRETKLNANLDTEKAFATANKIRKMNELGYDGKLLIMNCFNATEAIEMGKIKKQLAQYAEGYNDFFKLIVDENVSKNMFLKTWKYVGNMIKNIGTT